MKAQGAVEETLVEARGRIKRGWLQGHLADLNGNFCAVGALCTSPSHEALMDSEELVEFVVGIDKARRPRPEDLRPLAAWNDAPGRTKAEVVAAFDCAINVARTLGV